MFPPPLILSKLIIDGPSPPIGIWDIIGLGVWIFGFIIEVLADNGLDAPELLEVDGVFGPKTVEATVFVQEVMGLDTTGACDQATWHMILSQ